MALASLPPLGYSGGPARWWRPGRHRPGVFASPHGEDV